MILVDMGEKPYYYSEKASRSHAKAMKASPTSSTSDEMRPLSEHFQPGPMDVICARGRDAFNHSGNVRFRSQILSSLEEYSKAPSKLDKSLLVSAIVNSVRQESPTGGFVRQKKGLWYEVGDHIAREKVGQSFRDLLHTQYRSSTKAKKSHRLSVDAKLGHEIDKLVQQNTGVKQRMDQITRRVSEKVEDQTIKDMFDAANSELLQYIKDSKPLQTLSMEGKESSKACEPVGLGKATVDEVSDKKMPPSSSAR